MTSAASGLGPDGVPLVSMPGRAARRGQRNISQETTLLPQTHTRAQSQTQIPAPAPPVSAPSLIPGWETYPLGLPSCISWSKPGRQESQRLTDDAGRLFSEWQRACLEVWDVPRGSSEANSLQPSVEAKQLWANQDKLEGVLMDDRQFHWRSFTINQANSWGKLSVTEQMLRKLLMFYQVPSAFLCIVHFFGRQTREQISSSAGFRSAFPLKAAGPHSFFSEVCFKLIYVEKHGRPEPEDPWSIRQTGCYQRFDHGNSSSICIHIQPPKEVRERLSWALANGSFSETLGQPGPMSVHLVFVGVAMQNWPAYVSYLGEELVKHRECVLVTEDDWRGFRESGHTQVDYSHYRKLHRYLRDKLQKTLLILDSNLDVVRGLQKHNNGLKQRGLVEDENVIIETADILEQSAALLVDLKRDTAAMLEDAEVAAQMVRNLLEVRNDKLIKSHTTAVEQLVCMAEVSRVDTQVMVEFANRTKQDSRTMKIATMLATLYLPATFVATVFGTDLFHSDIRNGGGKPRYTLSVDPNIWIFVLAALCFTVVTVTFFLLWEWWAGKQEDAEVNKRRNSFKAGEP